MNTEEISSIESSLGYVLPSHYREFMLRYADELAVIKAKLPLRAVIHTSSQPIIQDNRDARLYADTMTIMQGDDEKPWPEDYFIVGTNGAGDYYFLMRNGCDLGLWFWSHESHEASCMSSSMEAYLADLRHALDLPERWQM